MVLHKGIIKWFNNEKGFGFIKQHSGMDIFVHYSVVQMEGYKSLEDGELVYYERHVGDKGPYASCVFRANAHDNDPLLVITTVAEGEKQPHSDLLAHSEANLSA